MSKKLSKWDGVLLLSLSLALILLIGNAVIACDCEGCKWINTGIYECDIDGEAPQLKCIQGHYIKQSKTDYNFISFTYSGGLKMFKEYDCTTAIENGLESWPTNACTSLPSGCSFMQDSGDDVPTSCSDSPC